MIERLYENLRTPLLALIKQKITDESRAEDILHDVFLRVQEHLSQVKDATKIESWIFQIARNLIADEHRRAKSIATIDDEFDCAEESAETATTRLSDSVRAFVEQLPEPYRTALVLSDLENVPQQEIAARMNLSLSGAKSRIQRARKMLKDLYLQCCTFEQNRHHVVLDYEPRTKPSACDPR